MALLDRLRRRLRALARKAEIDREMDEEMAFHIEMEAQELVRTRGLSPEAARQQAMRDFGRVERYRQEGRDARGVRVVEELLADVRFALRMCVKHVGFASATVLALALGIGASTAVFSVVHGVLLKPLPFPDAESLVSVVHSSPPLDLEEVNHGPATYFTYLANQRAFEAVGGWETNEASVTGGGEPEQVEVLSVTHGTLPVLRVQPLIGRIFEAGDDAPGAPQRAVLSHGYWQRRFGGSPGVVSETLEVDGAAVEIIGVLPPSFRFLDAEPALLLPMALDPADATGIEFGFQLLGRLRPGVTIEQATADVARMIPLLPAAFESIQLRPTVRPLADDVIGDVGGVLWILLAAVGLVLLIACGNVANLFLVRTEGRQAELAMRTALGAGRGRIARVLLTESLLLAVAGGAVGVALAAGALRILRTIAPADLPRVAEIGIDPTVLVFTLAVSLLSGLIFGCFAVLRFGTPQVEVLREGGRSMSVSPARQRTRNALAVFQVALALMLMIGSGLMVRSFLALRQVHPGFTAPEQVQTFRVAVPESSIESGAELVAVHEGIAQRLAAIPGVRSVGLSSSVTMDGEDNANPLQVEGFPVPDGTLPPLRRFKSVAPGYFETMGNPVVAGRSVTWDDVRQARPVVVVSEPLAREQWGDAASAIGQRVRGFTDQWHEVVGVVGGERDDGVSRPATPIVYWPMLNDSYVQTTMSYVVRSDRVGSPGFLEEVRQAVWAVDPDLPIASVATLDRLQARSMARTAFAMVMLGIAASVALLLGVVGIYGVIAYLAAQRTREIGLRMALGAPIGELRRMFLRYGLRLTLTGIAVGLGAALLLTRVLSSLLFDVAAVDPLSYAAVSAVLAAVATLATYLPARRATRVDPMIALRADG